MPIKTIATLILDNNWVLNFPECIILQRYDGHARCFNGSFVPEPVVLFYHVHVLHPLHRTPRLGGYGKWRVSKAV